MPVTLSPVLVTGASGFIASRIVEQLLAKGYRVRGTVRSLNKERELARRRRPAEEERVGRRPQAADQGSRQRGRQPRREARVVMSSRKASGRTCGHTSATC